MLGGFVLNYRHTKQGELARLGRLSDKIMKQMVGLTEAIHEMALDEANNDIVFVGGENDAVGKIPMDFVAR